MEKTVVYTRVSGKAQDDNYSKGVQFEACESFAAQHNWGIHSHLHDTQSGKDFQSRANFQECIRLVRLGVAQYVTFSVIDRIGRDFQVFESFTKEIYQHGGKIAVAGNNKVYQSYDEFWLECISEVAEAVKERLKIKKRTGDARMKAFLEGSYMKRAPFGYVIETRIKKINGMKERFNDLEIVKPQAESIERILEKYVETRSIAAVCRFANEEGLHHSIEATGEVKTFWHYQTVRTIIEEADMYAGIPQQVKFRDTPPRKDKETGELKIPKDNPEITYTYPEVISKELAKSVRLARMQGQGRVNETDRPKPFHRLVLCSCGRHAVYETHQTLKLAKFMCSSWSQVKQAKNVRGKEYHANPCKHSISPVFFTGALEAYLEALDPDGFVSTAELALLEVFDTYTGMQGLLNSIDAKKTELSEMKTSLVRRSILLDPENEADKVKLAVFDEEVVKLQGEINQLAEQYRLEEARKAKIETLFNELDITYEVRASFLNQLGDFNLSKVVPRLDKVRVSLTALKTALAAEAWDEVSRLMVFLGLRFEADFSEPGKLARRASIKVRFLMEDDIFTPVDGEDGDPSKGDFFGTTTSSTFPSITSSTPCVTSPRSASGARPGRTRRAPWTATGPRCAWGTPRPSRTCTAPPAWSSALTGSTSAG